MIARFLASSTVSCHLSVSPNCLVTEIFQLTGHRTGLQAAKCRHCHNYASSPDPADKTGQASPLPVFFHSICHFFLHLIKSEGIGIVPVGSGCSMSYPDAVYVQAQRDASGSQQIRGHCWSLSSLIIGISRLRRAPRENYAENEFARPCVLSQMPSKAKLTGNNQHLHLL